MSPDGASTKMNDHVNGGAVPLPTKPKSFDHPLDPLSPKEVCYLTAKFMFTVIDIVITAD